MPTATNKQVISAMYSAVFNRAPDAAGLSFWEVQFSAHANSIAALAAGFANHPVFAETYGAMDNLTFVQSIYQNVLGGPGDAGGVVYWNNLISNGVSRSDMLASFVEGALTIDLSALKAAGQLTDAEFTAAVARQDQLTNKANVGLQFAALLGAKSNLDPATDTTTAAGLAADPAYLASQAAIRSVTNDDATALAAITLLNTAAANADPIAYVNTNAPGVAVPVGETFTLTTSADTVPGTTGNDAIFGTTVNAGTGSTLNVFDTIDGGAGTDTLNLNMATTAMAMTGANVPVLTNVEILSLSNETGTNSFVGSVAPSLTTFNVANAQAATTTTNTITAATANLKTFGFKDITGTGSDISITTAVGVNTGTTDSYTVNLSNVAVTAPNAADSADLVFVGGAAGSGIETLTINTAVASQLGKLNVYSFGTTAGLETLVLNGAGKLTINGVAGDAAGAVGFKGTTSTINASGSTGGVDVTAGTSITTFTGGTANDTLRFNAAGDLTSADVINMGTGTNTIFVADTAIGGSGTTALNSAINAITTAQILGVSAAATVDMSGVTATTLSLGAGNNVVVQKLEATDHVIVQGVTAGNLDATASLGFNTLNIELAQDTLGVAAVGTVNATNDSTINIISSSTGTATTANTMGAVTNATNAVVTITGSQALTVASLSAAASVNAADFTGILTITGGNAASSFTGGSKADVITGGTAAGGDTFIGGAGNDTLATGAVTGIVADVITGGLGADTINVQGVSAAAHVVTINATAAESFATAGQFDTVTFSDGGVGGTQTATLVTGLLSTTLTGATSVTLGTTIVTAGSFLAVGSVSATLTTTNQNFSIYQDSNSNGIIDTTDLRVDFTDVAAADTMAIALVGNQVVVTDTFA